MRALVGLEGCRLAVGERERLARFALPGVLLLRHNVQDRERLLELCERVDEVVRETRGHPAILAVDEEGGAVSPLAPAIGNSPSAAACGVLADPRTTEQIHAWRARRTREVGPNLILAPVADIDRAENPVIATRAFGRQAGPVVEQVAAALRGLHGGGVRSCLKHWPGHGPVHLDSHYHLPQLQVDQSEWESRDLLPFAAALAHDASIPRPDSVMVAHVVAKFLDSGGSPATASPRIVRDWLRGRWGWEGAILSDALEMEAFRGVSPVAAFDAGCDLLLLSTPLGRLRTEVVERLLHPREDDAEAETRIARLATPRRFGAGDFPRDPAWEERSIRAHRGVSKGPSRPSWVMVDAASHDRLLRPPGGVDPMRREDPRMSVGVLGPEFEVSLGPPLVECRLASQTETPGGLLDPVDPDWCVLGSVRPLSTELREWLEAWLERRSSCAVALLGAAAFEVDDQLQRVLERRNTLWCPDFHAEARRAVASRIAAGG